MSGVTEARTKLQKVVDHLAELQTTQAYRNRNGSVCDCIPALVSTRGAMSEQRTLIAACAAAHELLARSQAPCVFNYLLYA